MTFGGHRQEDRHWVHTLRSLAAAFGVEGEVDDRERVRRPPAPVVERGANVWHNAGIRSGMYTARRPCGLRPGRSGGA